MAVVTKVLNKLILFTHPSNVQKLVNSVAVTDFAILEVRVNFVVSHCFKMNLQPMARSVMQAYGRFTCCQEGKRISCIWQ